MRAQAAFPFDWITTLDSERFLQILEDDFAFFLDDQYLSVASEPAGSLLNTRYHVEFLHEGNFNGDGYAPNIQKLKSKYEKRIERFRSLAEYPGKVVFLRTAYEYSTTNTHRTYLCSDNLNITDEYAWKLYLILQNFFPKLDFILIVINNDQGEGVREEIRLNDRLIKIKSNWTEESSLKYNSYKKFFQGVL